MDNPGILVDFAEEILAVDELEWASPQIEELDPKSMTFLISPLRDDAYYVGVVHSGGLNETLANAVPCAWDRQLQSPFLRS